MMFQVIFVLLVQKNKKRQKHQLKIRNLKPHVRQRMRQLWLTFLVPGHEIITSSLKI
jgi:hypothetical protein